MSGSAVRAREGALFEPLTHLAALGLYTLLALATVVLGLSEWRAHREALRGVEAGTAIALPPPTEPRVGVNVSLEQYPDDASLRWALRLARTAGVSGIRQRVSWAAVEPAPGDYRWEEWDRILPMVEDYGLEMIAVLEGTPRWARPADERGNPYAPPADLADYARFAGAFAARYAGRIAAYQVWDQPNIAPHWGAGEIDPAGYVEMLRLASEAIRTADPETLVIGGGLAPNTEPGGRNMSDVQFLREIYRRGAAAYFDVLGAKPYGFWSGPYDRRVDPDVLNYSRVILLREEMVRRGDGDKPIWGVEAGWAALPADWAGDPPPQGADAPEVQAQRLGAAIERMHREWPWMGYLVIEHLQPDVPAADPRGGFALLSPEGEPTALHRAVREAVAAPQVAHPGLSGDPSTHLVHVADMPLTQLRFWGTGVEVEVERGRESGALVVLRAGAEDVLVGLEGAPGEAQRVRLAAGLPLQEHLVQIRGTPAQLAAIRAVRVTRAAPAWGLWLRLGAGVLLLGWSAVGVAGALRYLPVLAAWRGVRGLGERLPAATRPALLGAALAAVVFLPDARLRLAALAGYGGLALLWPTPALYAAVLAVPLAPVMVHLGVGTFSLAEITLLVAAAAQGWSALLRPWAEIRSAARRARAGLVALDVAVGLLVLVALGATVRAEYQRVAWRESRVVIAESAILYALVRTQTEAVRRRLLEVLVAGVVGVALFGLVRYASPAGVIEAEGVRRARAFYGSPNNLALVLERVWPLALALALWGGGRVRRWLYGAAAALMAALLVLTFSRGALLLGVPAAMLALALLRGRRTTWLLAGGALAGIALLVGVLGVERFASLADPSQGTTFLRLSLWRSAWAMAQDHPLWGVGPDNFLYYYGDYILPGAEVDRFLSHPHNLLLDFWLRLGAGGAAILVVLLAGYARRAWRILRSAAGSRDWAMAAGLTAGMAAALAHGAADAFFFVPELALWCMLALGWMAGARGRRSTEAETAGEPLTRP